MLTIPNPVASAALGCPDGLAVETPRGALTYAALEERVRRHAAALATCGIGRGDRVALWGAPSLEWVVAFHAVGWLGAAVAPLPARAPLSAVRARLSEAGARWVLVSPARWQEAAALGARRLPLSHQGPAGETPPERPWPLEEARWCVHTSGSSGPARVVALRTSQLLFSALGSAIRLGHDPADRWLCCLPLDHVAGLSILARCAWLGTTVVLSPRFDPREVARALDAGEATLVSLVPTMLSRVLDARPERPFPPTLRAILLGGDRTPPSLRARCAALDAPVATTWGMTETASQVATSRPGQGSADDGVGPPLPFARVQARVSADGTSRLWVTGPLAPGTDGAPFPTSDRGAVDTRGRVHVTGRVDGALTTGGETVSPARVEAVLRAHPAVADALVVGTPDPTWGVRLGALVTAVPGGPVTPAQALGPWCRARLEPGAVPRVIRWVPALPRGPLGKPSREAALTLLDTAAKQAVPTAPEHEEEGPMTAQTPPAARPAHGARDVLERVATRAQGGQLLHRLGELRAWLREDLGWLERELAPALPPAAHVAARAARHLLHQPGKRLRPLCVLLAARLGPRPDLGHARRLAAAAELVHAATLLHDDVIDEGDERRGAPAARVKYGNTASILAGDLLLVEALRRVRDTDLHEALSGLLGTLHEMVAAEALQLERAGDFRADEEACVEIARGKTAALFGWALEAGALAGGLEGREREDVRRAGEALGLAFQLVDDVFDLVGPRAVTGRGTFSDLGEGKVTWPLAYAAARDEPLARSLRALARGEIALTPDLAGELCGRVLATGALEATYSEAERFAGEARQRVARLPPGEAQEQLALVVELALVRLPTREVRA